MAKVRSFEVSRHAHFVKLPRLKQHMYNEILHTLLSYQHTKNSDGLMDGQTDRQLFSKLATLPALSCRCPIPSKTAIYPNLVFDVAISSLLSLPNHMS